MLLFLVTLHVKEIVYMFASSSCTFCAKYECHSNAAIVFLMITTEIQCKFKSNIQIYIEF